MSHIFIKICLLILTYYGVQCLRVIPYRANVTKINSKYLEYGRFYVNRYGRNSGYFMNVEGQTKHIWNNNVSAHLIFFEYLHNEYRRSFVEMHFRVCDLLQKEKYIGGMFRKVGVTCPLPIKDYHILNLTVEAGGFSSQWPFKKCRVDIELATTGTKENIGSGFLYLSFIEDIPKKIRRKN